VDVEHALLLVAFGFAFLNGFNDGGALLAIGLGVRTFSPLTGLLVLSAAVMVAPVVLGTQVATTLTSRLVGLEGPSGQLAVLVAVTVAVAVAFSLSRRGLPTSLTLALVGAIAGVGAGSGLPVAWPTIGIVLAFAALAPVVGLLGGWGMVLLLARTGSRAPLHRQVRTWHTLAFGGQCLAYGANDGQKMLAVFAVAAGTVGVDRSVGVVGWQLLVIGVLFLLGAMVGLPRFAGTIGTGVVPTQPPAAAITELSAAGVVLASGAFGSPVSMTQAISGALVGTAMPRGHGRVRWRAAARIGGAWLITLPATFALAAAGAAVLVR